MTVISDGALKSTDTAKIVICIVLGSVIGEFLKIESGIEKFGEWLKMKTKNSKDAGFTDAFVTATATVCVGAMAIIGSINDAIYGDISVLTAKAILDLIIITVMTSAMGKGRAERHALWSVKWRIAAGLRRGCAGVRRPER